MTKKVKKQCKWCNKDFLKREANKSPYCSIDCQIAYKKIELKCLNVRCNKSFYPGTCNQKFCSKDCLGIYNGFEYKAEYGCNGVGLYKLRFEVFKRDNFTCVYCGRNVKEDHIKLHCDHVIPKIEGGQDVINNLVTACKDCNLGKSDVLLNQ